MQNVSEAVHVEVNTTLDMSSLPKHIRNAFEEIAVEYGKSEANGDRWKMYIEALEKSYPGNHLVIAVAKEVYAMFAPKGGPR